MRRFAFTLPALNRESPDQRFEWTVLPQGMRNSPTLCQLYVDSALQPLRRKWPQTIIYHYMDDILFAQPVPFSQHQLESIQRTLAQFHLVIAPEKIQRTAPWKYLGWTLSEQVVAPQKLQLQTQIETLNDAQKLLGDLQWLKPIVGIPNELLSNLRPLLKGTDPTVPVHITPHQRDILQQIMDRVTTGQVRRRDPELPVDLTIWCGEQYPLAALTQLKRKTGELWVLEWISPMLQQNKTLSQKIEMLAELVKRGCERTLQVMGAKPTTIRMPMKKDTLQWYLNNSAELQEALLGASCIIETGKLNPAPLQWLGKWQWMTRPKRENTPIAGALTVYTDAGKRSRTAAVTWQEKDSWKHKILSADERDTLQTLELLAVVWTMINFKEPLNIVTDSLYVAGVVQRIEDASIKEIQNQRLFELLVQLWKAAQLREHAYAIIHIRSHKWDIGLGEGNARADELVMMEQNTPMSKHQLAREAHSMFHQNARGLSREFRLPLTEARGIVRACPTCSHHNGGCGLGLGVNPRGLLSNELWQMDVSHVPSFGCLKYVHVTVDTYSKYVWATAQMGERAIHVERHLYSCFPVMGTPKRIKTDNGPAYVSRRIEQFFCQLGNHTHYRDCTFPHRAGHHRESQWDAKKVS